MLDFIMVLYIHKPGFRRNRKRGEDFFRIKIEFLEVKTGSRIFLKVATTF